MILTRTPCRCSFFGGGTDYSQWFLKHEGAVLATTINKYCYVALQDGKSAVFFDVPTKAGLATSSAYTVGLLRACTNLDKVAIAKLATTLEMEKMGGNIGAQDQYLCAIGGFHLLRFSEHGIRDIPLSREFVEPLQDYLMLFNTHQYRLSGAVVSYQLAEMKRHKALYMRMVQMVEDGAGAIKRADFIGFGQLLNEAWQIKRQLSKHVSTPDIDAIYEKAMRAGATGGKLLGGGGGGFMVLFVEPEKQEAVKGALGELGYTPFKFEYEGTQVIYRDD